MGLTLFPNGVASFGVPVFGGVAGVAMTGNYWFVNPATGADGNAGNSPAAPLATLYKALAHCIDGNNDVIVLIGNGQASGTARLSLALAQAQTPSATTGTLVWNKNATHLIGICAPTGIAQRARIAPPSGTYTQTTFGSGNLVTVTGSGCVFSNVSLFHGFSTGGTNQICWTDTGNRNAYINMDFGGMGDATSAADAGSRSFKLGAAGSGENYFQGCTFGLDTQTRGAANASLELAGATPRNVFKDCLFLLDASASTPLHVIGSGADCLDRVQEFKDCTFLNSIKSGATTISEVISLTNAAPGGLIALKSCMTVGATKWGDTNALANTYVDMPVVSAAAGGLALNPS